MRILSANKQKMPLDSESRNIVLLSGLAIIIFVVMGFLNPKTFLSLTNLQGMCVQFAEFGILSYGMMMAMISGGIDLSLVGIANLTGIICSLVIKSMGGTTTSILLGMGAGLLVGIVCGIINGFFIGYFQIPPMLVTLSGLQLYTGIGLSITKGPAITGLPESFSQISNGKIYEIPYSLIIFTIITIVLCYLMKSTVYGQHVYFMGTNPVASRYSRSEEHTSELQSQFHLVCRLLLEKKKQFRKVRLRNFLYAADPAYMRFGRHQSERRQGKSAWRYVVHSGFAAGFQRVEHHEGQFLHKDLYMGTHAHRNYGGDMVD